MSEDAGVVTLIIERIGANGIPVNISITSQDLNATGMLNTSTVQTFGCETFCCMFTTLIWSIQCCCGM